MAAGALERLRFSRREIDLVAGMITHHLRPAQLGRGEDELPTPRAIYRYFRDTGEAGTDTLFLSLADHLATRGPHLDPAEWQRHARVTAHLLEAHQRSLQEVKTPRLVDGHDLMRHFGLAPGPRLGELLEGIKEAQAAGEVRTPEEALAWVERQLRG